jgi:hypothetical protein
MRSPPISATRGRCRPCKTSRRWRNPRSMRCYRRHSPPTVSFPCLSGPPGKRQCCSPGASTTLRMSSGCRWRRGCCSVSACRTLHGHISSCLSFAKASRPKRTPGSWRSPCRPDCGVKRDRSRRSRYPCPARRTRFCGGCCGSSAKSRRPQRRTAVKPRPFCSRRARCSPSRAARE